MSAHPPPVPKEQRPPQGNGETEATHEPKPREYGRNRNPEEQGRQGNVNENTHNVGYQQDR